MNLVKAIRHNTKISEIEELIKKGADVNEGEYDSYMERTDYPLDQAAFNLVHEYALRCSKLLLENGAEVDGESGAVALGNAAYQGNLELVKLLVEKGADVNRRKGENGGNSLHSACSNSIDIVKREQDFLDVAEILLLSGGNPNFKDFEGNTPLDYAEGLRSTKMCDLLKLHGAH